MGEIFYKIKDILELTSYIATIIGVISVIIAVISLLKNKPTKKRFKVKFNVQSISLAWEGILLIAALNFENFTDKEFSVTSLSLFINKNSYPVTVRSNIQNTTLIPLKDIYFTSHSSETFNECFVSLPENLTVTSAFLKVETTVGNFVYSVNIRQLRDDIQKL